MIEVEADVQAYGMYGKSCSVNILHQMVSR